MTFPLMPYGGANVLPPATATYLGFTYTSGTGFPTGSVTTSAATGTRNIVVVFTFGNATTSLSGVTIDGVSATLVGSSGGTFIYWASTSAASTLIALAGSATVTSGGGRCTAYVYEIMQSSLYKRNGPVSFNTASATTGTSLNLSVTTNSGDLVIAGGVYTPNGTVTVTPSPTGGTLTLVQQNREGITQHVAWDHYNTAAGTTYATSKASSGAIYLIGSVWR